MAHRGFYVVIPARFASVRLPGKPLLDICGLPMVVRVFQQAKQSGAEQVIIATDDERIAAAAREHGARVEMTESHHQTGTDRIAEVAARLAWSDEQIVVNVQGDEPLIPPALIAQVAELLAEHPAASIATLATTMSTDVEFRDPNTAKIVADKRGYAMYFSRAPIPWPREGEHLDAARRHIGIYAYRAGQLRTIASSAPCELEGIERLEQLRALWLGYKIIVADAVAAAPRGVDTEADLAAARECVALERARAGLD